MSESPYRLSKIKKVEVARDSYGEWIVEVEVELQDLTAASVASAHPLSFFRRFRVADPVDAAEMVTVWMDTLIEDMGEAFAIKGAVAGALSEVMSRG